MVKPRWCYNHPGVSNAFCGFSGRSLSEWMVGGQGSFAMSLERALSIFLILAPFCGAPVFARNLLSLPGTKPLLLFALLLSFIALVNHRRSIKMARLAFFFAIILITLFTVSIVRSLPHLPQIASSQNMDDTSTSGYLLSYFIKPLIYFLPFIIITKFF